MVNTMKEEHARHLAEELVDALRLDNIHDDELGAAIVLGMLKRLNSDVGQIVIGTIVASSTGEKVCPEGHLVPPQYFDSVGSVYVCKICNKHYPPNQMTDACDSAPQQYKLPDPPKQPTDENVALWFQAACEVIADMLTDKRKAYGDNLSDTQRLLLILYPEGIPPTAYAEALVMVRIFDKFKRRANYHKNPDNWEDQENPWLDVSGYGVAILYDIMRGAIK